MALGESVKVSDVANEDSLNPAVSANDGERQKRREAKLTEYFRRRHFVIENYSFWKNVFGDNLPFNKSLGILRKAVDPDARSREPIRLSPELETAIGMGVGSRRRDQTSLFTYKAPSTTLVRNVCVDVATALAPIRGAPGRPLLTFHVQALVILNEWALGIPVTASRTKNSVYDPQMTSPGAQAIQAVFAELDPEVTVTTMMNIVHKSRASRELDGKRFGDFFPFYGGSVSAKTGLPIPGPGFKLEKFGLTHPIYCS